MTTHPVSPNTVLANALQHAEDVLTPRILAAPPERIVLVVGTQINGAPHIGTSLVQSLAFAMAARLRDRFDLPTEVLFNALDNAPYELTTDRATGHRYQRAYAQALGDLVSALYQPLFTTLSRRLGIPHRVETYTQQQAGEHFRRAWLRLLPRLDAARWWLAPSTGTPHLRIPCPHHDCGWAEKHAERTRVHPSPAPRPRKWPPSACTTALPGHLPTGAADWMLDTRQWPGTIAEYAEQLLAMPIPCCATPATSSARTRPLRSAA